MINVKDILFEICENEKVYDSNFDLVESGILDSLAFIQLFERLEEEKIQIVPTRIDSDMLRTSGKITELVEEFCKNNEK